MDTKMEALEKAQRMQRDKINNGECAAMQHYVLGCYFNVEWTSGHAIFKYAEPKPLEKDTLCLCGDGVMRYAKGELNEDGVNKFYAQGFCSKNVGRGYSHSIFKDFEIIETPGEFERVWSINTGHCTECSNLDNVKHNNLCRSCTVMIGNPSNFNLKK